jgi:hypothetical protein
MMTSTEEDAVAELITVEDLYGIIRQYLNFPHPRVCRHMVACDLLQLMEQKGYALDGALVKAVVDANDEAALAILDARGAEEPARDARGADEPARDPELYRMPGNARAVGYSHLCEQHPPSNIYLETSFWVEAAGYMSSCKAYVEPDGTWHFAEVAGMSGDRVVLWRIWPGAMPFGTPTGEAIPVSGLFSYVDSEARRCQD